MPTPEKEALVAALREAADSSTSIYLTEFRHLNVAEMNELRGQILDKQARLRIAKNRLLKLAFVGTQAEGLIEFLSGPTAVTFCQTDPVAIAKVLTEFGKDHEYLALKAGLMDGQIFDQQQVMRLAELPPRDQLLAQTLAAIIAPASALVNLLGGITSQFVFTLDAIADQRQQQEQE